jgi:hypothetical protein
MDQRKRGQEREDGDRRGLHGKPEGGNRRGLHGETESGGRRGSSRRRRGARAADGGRRRPTPALGLTTGDAGTWSTASDAGARRAWQAGYGGGGLEIGGC